MILDINTERGRDSLWDEIAAIQFLKARWPGCVYAHTDKQKSAAVDAIILRHERIHAVAETKCRQMTLSELHNRFNSEWLVTYDKLKRAAQVADLLCVEFWGLLYLVPDKTLLRVKLYHDGHWLVPMRIERTETQKTINGGKIIRENAFIDMRRCDVL